MRRGVAGAVGVVFSGAGAFAVFGADNDLGSVALLALGGLFGLLSLTGYAPTSVKFGENEFRFNESLAYEIVEQIDTAPPPVAKKLAEVVQEAGERSGGPLPDSVRWAVDSWEYTESLFRSLSRLVPRWERHETVDQVGDASIPLNSGKILVEAKFRHPPGRLSPTDLDKLLGQVAVLTAMAERAGASHPVALLIVTNVPLSTFAQQALRDFDKGSIRVVRWRDSQDDMELQKAINELAMDIGGDTSSS